MSDTRFIASQVAATNLQEICHAFASESGWWVSAKTRLPIQPEDVVPEKLLLIHSEISEACEGFRKNAMDDHLPHRKMLEVELADALIRICDLAGALELDLGGAVSEKLAYNQQRADHRLESRALANGKRF